MKQTHRSLTEMDLFPDPITDIVCDYLFPFTARTLVENCHHVSVIDDGGQRLCTVDENDSLKILKLDSDAQIVKTSLLIEFNDYVDQIVPVYHDEEKKSMIMTVMNRGQRIIPIDADQIKTIPGSQYGFHKLRYDYESSVQCATSLHQPDQVIIATGIKDEIISWKLREDQSMENIYGFKINCGPGFTRGIVDDRWVPVQCLTALTPALALALPSGEQPKERLATGSLNGWIKVWDLDLEQKTSHCVHSMNIGSKINCLIHLTHDGDSFLISGSHDGMIRVFDSNTLECKFMLSGHTDSVNSISVLKNQRICSGSDDGSIKIWDIGTRECLNTMQHADNNILCKIRYVGCLSGQIISLSEKNLVEYWSR